MLHRAAPQDLSVWIMDYALEVALYLVPLVPISLGGRQNVHSIARIVCWNIPCWSDHTLTFSADKSSPVSLTACDADTRTFTCGLDTTQCQSDNSTFVMAGGNALVLRPAQVEALTAGYTAGSHKNGASYGAGTLIGVALGIGLPLLFALVMALLVLRKEKQRCALRSMFEEQNLPSINVSSANPRRSFSTVSKAGTLTTISSTSTFKPQQPRAFLEKYGYHKGYYAHEGDLSVPVFELPTNPPERNDRVEAP